MEVGEVTERVLLVVQVGHRVEVEVVLTVQVVQVLVVMDKLN
jgi:hypothetical protein